ncbi:hypothetical protein EV175_000314 [Coemansia sp. RSA 1933]|nr:hypothetical protein EV175_000314 [Coemansia sp. RSA 1933]
MNSEYRAAARILSTSQAPAIVSETTHDLLVRSAQTNTDWNSLLHLGQYATTLRVRTAQERKGSGSVQRSIVGWAVSGIAGQHGPAEPDAQTVACIKAMLVAAENQTTAKGAGLVLVGGVVLALVGESVEHPALVTAAVGRFVQLAVSLSKPGDRTNVGDRALLVACAEVVPLLNASPRLRTNVGQLAANGVLECVAQMLPAAVRSEQQLQVEAAKATRLVCTLIATPATSFNDARRIAQLFHASAAGALLEQENAYSMDRQADVLAQALLHGVDAVLERFFLEDAYQRVPRDMLCNMWSELVDTMAALHFATLQSGGREGSDVFRRASTRALQFMTAQPAAAVDEAVQRMFAMQPCLRFMATQPVAHISGARSCLVLFYIDLLEHLVPFAATHTLLRLIAPLASRYAGAEALDVAGPEWFESAHALILAVLELVARDDSANTEASVLKDRAAAVLEMVPWYADLVLGLYPDRGISAELLRIAYTAAARATATNNWQSKIRVGSVDLGQTLAWALVDRLLSRLDAVSSNNDAGAVRVAVDAVRRRELLLVLADLLAAVPLELLPRLMPEVRSRLLAEREPGTRKALDDEIQQVVLAKADITRKVALSTWAWQLHSDSSRL